MTGSAEPGRLRGALGSAHAPLPELSLLALLLALGCGVVGYSMLAGGDPTGWGPAVLAVAGLAFALRGWRQARLHRGREADFDQEVAKARAEWSELQELARASKRDGGDLDELLARRGYRHQGVIRWLSGELSGLRRD